MANKFRSISELSEQTAKQVTKSVDGWKSYLDTAARLYKYPFDEQLLIYAQRPDATACAEMETWNDKMHRWVKPGSKGIALIRKTNGGKAHLEYIFDVADTRPVKGAKTPYLWCAKEQNYDAILKTMEAQYGKTDGQDFGENLMEYAARAVQVNYQEFLHDLHGNLAGSLLDGLDDLNLNVQFRNVLTSTVQYTLLTRCGLDPSQYLEDEDLQGIVAFSTPVTLTHLGVAANSISGDLLSEIGKTIRLFDKETLQNHQQSLRKTLANSEDIGYTKDTKEFNGLNRESEAKNAGIDLHEERGLSDSGFSDGRAGGNRGNATGQVREAAGDIPERTSTGDIHLNVDDRQIGETLEGDRPNRTGTSRRDGSRNDEAARDRREAESTRPVSMGGRDEQSDSASRRNSDERSHIHINENEQETAGEKPAVFASIEAKSELFQLTLFPTVEEQIENITQAQDVEHGIQKYASTSVFSDKSATKVPDAVIAHALTSGGNNPHSIERIVAFFQKSPTDSASASFMKQEYGTGGKG